jgi:hypothetical protein
VRHAKLELPDIVDQKFNEAMAGFDAMDTIAAEITALDADNINLRAALGR